MSEMQTEGGVAGSRRWFPFVGGSVACLLALATAACGPGETSPRCDEGERAVDFGQGLECLQTCESTGDCPSAEAFECVGSVCVPQRRGGSTCNSRGGWCVAPPDAGGDGPSCPEGERWTEVDGDQQCRRICRTVRECPDAGRFRCLGSVCVRASGGTDAGAGRDTSHSDAASGDASGDLGERDGEGALCGGAGEGSLECVDGLVCSAACGDEDDSCRQNVRRRLATEECRLLADYSTCVEERCAEADDETACVRRNCSAERGACVEPPPEDATDLDCGGALLCVSDCPRGSETPPGETRQCQRDCLRRTSDQGRQKVQAYTRCMRRNCRGAEDRSACRREECTSAWRRCWGCP